MVQDVKPTVFTHDELVARAVRWLRRPASSKRADGTVWYKGGCGVVVPELVSYAGETPDAIGWVNGGYSYLIECKTSLSDFYADRKKPRHRTGKPGIGAECFYLCPAGLITPEKLPPGWGLLYCHPKKITIEVVPTSNPNRDLTGEISLMYSLLRRVEVRGLLTQCLAPKWGGDGTLGAQPAETSAPAASARPTDVPELNPALEKANAAALGQ